MKSLFVAFDKLIFYQMPYYIINIIKILIAWSVLMLHLKNKELQIWLPVPVLYSQGQNHNVVLKIPT